jgi:hypothetical protein
MLRAFLPEPEPELAVDAMTPKVARALARFQHGNVRRMRHSYAVSTRRAVLGHVHRFYQWATAQRYIPCNPFDGIRAAGISRTTECRLHPDEAQTWIGVALAEAEAGDVRALGALLVLAMRLRTGQVLSLQVGDVDLAALALRVSAFCSSGCLTMSRRPLASTSLEYRQPYGTPPSLTPCSLRCAIASRVRSAIASRSHCATDVSTLRTSLPLAVRVLIESDSDISV